MDKIMSKEKIMAVVIETVTDLHYEGLDLIKSMIGNLCIVCGYSNYDYDDMLDTVLYRLSKQKGG